MNVGGIIGAGGVSSRSTSCLAGTVSSGSFHKKTGDVKTFVAKPKGADFTGGVKMEILSASPDGWVRANLSLVQVDLESGAKAETLPSDISITKGTSRGKTSQTIRLSSTPSLITLEKDDYIWFVFRSPGKSGNQNILFTIVNGQKNLRVLPTNYVEGIVVIE